MLCVSRRLNKPDQLGTQPSVRRDNSFSISKGSDSLDRLKASAFLSLGEGNDDACVLWSQPTVSTGQCPRINTKPTPVLQLLFQGERKARTQGHRPVQKMCLLGAWAYLILFYREASLGRLGVLKAICNCPLASDERWN